MKKVAIYGPSSMAGHVLYEYFSLKDDYIIDCIEENEIFDENFIIRKDVAFSDSDYIINCIRCLVEESELNTTKAIKHQMLMITAS